MCVFIDKHDLTEETILKMRTYSIIRIFKNKFQYIKIVFQLNPTVLNHVTFSLFFSDKFLSILDSNHMTSGTCQSTQAPTTFNNKHIYLRQYVYDANRLDFIFIFEYTCASLHL